MAYKINGTTVVDNSRNVCACCVTSCCITASDRMDAPSGTTAQRPSSPATGSIYFDTDEGSLVSYNGTEWAKVGGSSGIQFACEVADGEPWTLGYLCIAGDRCRGACGLNCWQRRCTTMNNSWYCYNPMNPTCYASDQCLCAMRSSYLCRRYNPPGTSCYINLCHDYHCSNLANHSCQSCQNHWPGGQVFPDGSYCLSVAFPSSHSCISQLNQRSVFINRKGGISFSEDASLSFNPYCCFMEVSKNDFKALHYSGSGRNGPTAFLGQNLICLFGKFSDCTRSIACWNGNSYVLEIDTSTSGDSGFKVCCYTSFCCGLFVNPRELVLCCTLAPCIKACLLTVCSKTCQFNCCHAICCCDMCCQFGNYTIIPKEPTFSSGNPDCYCKQVDCDPDSGLKIKSNIDFVQNSVLYARNGTPTGTGRFCKLGCTACHTQEFTSADGCYLYVLFADRNATNCCAFCCCRCCENPSCPLCCIKFSCGVPAVEKIDLTNGCVVCSLFFCESYDCKVGNPNSVCARMTGINSVSGLLCSCFCNRQQGVMVSGTKGNSNNIGFVESSCITRSCACPTMTYFTAPRTDASIPVLIFNETDLNVYGNSSVNPYLNGASCAYRTLLEAYVGCCSGNTCWACLGTKVTDYLTAQGCTIRSSLSDTLFDLRLLGCACPGCQDVTPRLSTIPYKGFNLNSYINPYSNHLVTFSSIYSCCTGLHWVGAICHDLANDLCVSAVDTLWPTTGDFCLCALKAGLGCYLCNCWCGVEADMFKYECRPPSVSYYNCLSIKWCCQQCCPPMLAVETYETTEGGIGGLLIRQSCDFPSMVSSLSSICSTCRFCSACPQCPDAGYFGGICYGACVASNTCNGQQFGLRCAGLQSAVSSIPFCKPLCCSQMFDRMPKHKDLIEFFYGCHCLFRWWQALFENSSDYAAAEQSHLKSKETICMWCFSGKADLTCQYTLGCTNVRTWCTSYWCNKNRWLIADMATSCFHIMGCCSKTNYCLISESPLCFCCTTTQLCGNCDYCCFVTFQCFITCDMFNNAQRCCCCFSHCDTYIPAQAGQFIPCNTLGCNIIDNLNEAVFGNCATHSEGLPFSSRSTSVIVPNSCTTRKQGSCTIRSNWDERGVLSPTANTAFKGSAGITTEWFNRDYACIC